MSVLSLVTSPRIVAKDTLVIARDNTLGITSSLTLVYANCLCYSFLSFATSTPKEIKTKCTEVREGSVRVKSPTSKERLTRAHEGLEYTLVI